MYMLNFLYTVISTHSHIFHLSASELLWNKEESCQECHVYPFSSTLCLHPAAEAVKRALIPKPTKARFLCRLHLLGKLRGIEQAAAVTFGVGQRWLVSAGIISQGDCRCLRHELSYDTRWFGPSDTSRKNDVLVQLIIWAP